MVINEDTKSINVFEGLGFLCPSVADDSHWFTIGKSISNWVVHWVVEKSCKMVLVVTNIIRETVEALTHLEDTSCLAKFTPEVFRDFRNSINSDTVKTVVLD